MPSLAAASLAACCASAGASPAGAAETEGDSPRVTFETTHGSFVLELDRRRAPGTVANFLAYVRDGAYQGTVFHRVIAGFMVQGGGYDPEFKERPTRAPIRNEADRALANDRGTIAMARTSDPHSATMQFFINVVDNGFLNHTAPNVQGWGYAAFGRVVEGMETVDRIAALPTGRGGPFGGDVPAETVAIRETRLHPGE